jgi:hypothetical protein
MSADIEIAFTGPRDSDVLAAVEEAFASEGVSAHPTDHFTFAESEFPPIHIVVQLSVQQIETLTFGTLVVAAAKKIAEEAAKDAYSLAKDLMRRIARALVKSYERIKAVKERKTVFTVSVKNNDGRPIRYNVPSLDAEQALCEMIADILQGSRDPSRGDLFWQSGRWMDYDEFDKLRGGSGFDSIESAIPTLEFFEACGRWSEVVGSAAVFESLPNGLDGLLEFPSDADQNTRERAIAALREALPESTIGPAADRNVVFVSGAFVGPQPQSLVVGQEVIGELEICNLCDSSPHAVGCTRHPDFDDERISYVGADDPPEVEPAVFWVEMYAAAATDEGVSRDDALREGIAEFRAALGRGEIRRK